jgi:choline dehydrogenase-like flavoprotein
LASTDPLDAPLIDPNGYATEVDRCSLRDGVKQVVKVMLDTPEGREMVEDIISPDGYSKLTTTSSDAEIDAYIRRVATTTFHLGGTAAMGDVVDSDLSVVGIDRLRMV